MVIYKRQMSGASVLDSFYHIFNVANVGKACSAESALMMDVCQQLQCLFNCRQGSLVHMPEYGLPDFQAFNQLLPDPLFAFVEAVLRAIKQFEPRLHQVNVECDQQSVGAQFFKLIVSGCLAFHKPIAFIALMQSDGVITVQQQSQMSWV